MLVPLEKVFCIPEKGVSVSLKKGVFTRDKEVVTRVCKLYSNTNIFFVNTKEEVIYQHKFD